MVCNYKQGVHNSGIMFRNYEWGFEILEPRSVITNGSFKILELRSVITEGVPGIPGAWFVIINERL